MNERPQIGQPVAVRDADGAGYPSRVEGADGGVLTVGLPTGLPASHSYQVGMAFDVVWAQATGVCVLSGVLRAVRTENRIRLWDLDVDGATRVEQRREYVRVPVAGAIRIDLPSPSADVPETPAPSDDSQVVGDLVDLSEAALACRVRAGPADPRLATNTPVQCHFAVNDERFDLDGVIHSARPGPDPRDSRVVVVFRHSAKQADAVRKQVFDIQVQMRRSR